MCQDLLQHTLTDQNMLEGDLMKKFELFDKVRIKSENAIGFIVDIHENGKLDIEKEGNRGPVYWYIDESDIEKIE